MYIPQGTRTSKEGADAYSPLMLLKALLLQKWFRIPSDPEFENQINDRISFKKVLELPLDRPSPDYSTFSRFRSRISKEAKIELNNVVLQAFARRGLSINEGISDDCRLPYERADQNGVCGQRVSWGAQPIVSPSQ